ncbi:MAG TPA: sigma 54-interacting transcriptional regulator [Polyangiaceae bacterium]|nr:sigma 54-interacting transcriptional regulator [Polyangiaceae bacterium]
MQRLGRGATGDVWLSRSSDGAALVLKFARDRAAYARLAEEGQRLLGVDSPFCVRLLGAGRLGSELAVDADGERSRIARGTPYLVLEHHEGTTLDTSSFASRAEARVLLVARDIGRALCDLHATGVAHGDVKPANVLIEPAFGSPRARLMDFGLAGASDEAEARGGTRRYLAPEAFEAPLAGDARLRDLYALGVTLAEAAAPEVAGAERPEVAFEALPIEAEVKALVRALLSRVPAARPSAEWVYLQAFRLLGELEPEAEKLERRLGQVRRSYLSLRRAQLLVAARHPKSEVRVESPAREWLSTALELSRQVEELRGSIGSGELVTLNDWDSVGRARWLVELVGSPAAAWPELPVKGDGELAGRLLSAVRTREPRRLTFADLESNLPGAAPGELREPVELALALGRGAAQAATLDAAERLVQEGGAPRALGLALGRALRLRGQLARALSVLSRVEGPEARLEAAEVWRRAGSPASARGVLAELDTSALSEELRDRERAIRARLLYDDGNPRAAFDLLEPMPRGVSALEVRALSEIALSRRKDAEATLARAQLLAESDEERARVAAVAGNLAHFEGDLTRALGHTRRAAEHAARAGAVLEEATYLTSVAAAASNVGELGLSRSAAGRALLLFESLGRTREVARAELSLSGVHAALGAVIEAKEHALAAAQHAKAAGDKRCRAYAQLVLADILPPDDPDGVEHARFAATLIDDDLDDRLRVAARLHARGEDADWERLDELASAPDRALDARLEWWTARARVASVSPSPLSPRRPLEALLSQVSESAPCLVRGPAFAAGAELAARLGDGDAVRRLTLGASEAARELTQRAGSELAAAVRALPWVRLADAGQTSPFSLEQLSDVDRLVRALGRRDRLRPLLEQVVDALVLWTGVERGLLLLRAPGGRLQPRAGRNLLRVDLVGAQLALSHSLAERALSLGEPVVAVDAAGDLPEMHESVHALKLRSVLAVPLIARGEALGVVYLDDRARRGAFGPRELSWVRLVATLAAVAIADARDQILLRRAARRARRAEARLSVELAKREAELDVAERELARTRDARETRFRYDEIVGRSEATRTMLRLVDRIAASDVPVLLSGESGSGKELVARAIHRHGARSGQAFVAENCGAIPETLLESALFGHVRGAFTGAQRPRAGLFEIAHRGTLLLDEIGEMSLGMQAKLLRALQDGEIRPVGSERSKTVDVRVIGATHRDLAAMVTAGKFREDLYYRLNVISMRIPSLRERIGDAAILVKHFMALHAGTRRVHISRTALDMLSAYGWPGNVRQLENEVRRALVLADDTILPEHLTPEISARGEAKSVDELNLRQRVDALEVELVRIALRRTDGNQTRAAELLGVSRFGLQKMMKRLEISLESGHA